MPDPNKGVKKVLVVGDGECGKTCLLYQYVQNVFRKDYVPTVFETTDVPIRDSHGRVYLTLQLWDTAGQEDYARIRTLSYPDTDLALICFSVVDKQSFRNVAEMWAEEVNHFCKNVPKIVVGLKSDLRSEKNRGDCVNMEKAIAVAKAIGAKKYIECSAKTGDNVGEVFCHVLEVLSNRKNKKASKLSKICTPV